MVSMVKILNVYSQFWCVPTTFVSNNSRQSCWYARLKHKKYTYIIIFSNSQLCKNMQNSIFIYHAVPIM